MKMYDNYSPLDLLHKPFSSPIFQYEINHLRWKPEFEDIRGADWAFTWTIFGFQLLITVLLGVLQPFSVAQLLFFISLAMFVVFGPLVSTIVVELRTVLLTVTFWHTHTQADGLDLLRLTMPTDGDLLTMLRAAAELVAWRGMRWEMALRSFVTFCGIAIVVSVGLFITLNTLDDRQNFSLLLFAFPYWVFRLLMLYLREPLWRMRTLVALSIAVASRVSDSNAAILAASVIAMFLKVTQFAGTVALIMITLNFTQLRDGQASSYVTPSLWLIGSGILTTPLVRRAYGALHALCTHLTLRTMRGADGFPTIRSSPIQ